MRQKNFLIGFLLFLTTVYVTRVFQVPIIKLGNSGPENGYFNLGDTVVIFSGLFMGPRWGFLVGAAGSAVGDLISPYWYFALLTFIAKGLEGLFAGCLARSQRKLILGAGLGASCMVLAYFVGEYYFMPSQGPEAAITELPFNIAQGIIGILIGVFCRYIVDYLFGEENTPLRADQIARLLGSESDRVFNTLFKNIGQAYKARFWARPTCQS